MAAIEAATAVIQPGGAQRDAEVIAAPMRPAWRWCSPECGTFGTEFAGR